MRRMRAWAVVIAAGIASLAFAAGAQAVPAGSDPVLQSWQTNGRVQTIVISGSTAYLGGQFTSVRPSGDPVGTGEVPRAHAAAIDLETGALLPWDPEPNNTVQTIAVDSTGTKVYLGGMFSQVGGKTHSRLAEVDALTGAPVSTFKAKTNGQVMSIAVGPNGLYAGGTFTVGALTHPYVAEFDLTTGALMPGWTATTSNKVNAIALSADGSRVIIAGNFLYLDNTIHFAIGAVDPTTGAALPWLSRPLYAITTLAVDANGVYAAGTGNGGTVAAFNPTTGQQLWMAGVDGNDQAITVDPDGTVYVGGHFNNYCGPVPGRNVCTVATPRDHLLALNSITGAILPWHPSANGVLGVFALAAGDGTLEAGGDFTRIGGADQQGFAAFPELNDPTLTDSTGGLPATAPVTVIASGTADSAPGFNGYRYQTSTDGGVTWSALRTGATALVKDTGTTLVRFEGVDLYGNTSGWVQDSVTIS
jgi:outer membrane protein assembly factor BamB